MNDRVAKLPLFLQCREAIVYVSAEIKVESDLTFFSGLLLSSNSRRMTDLTAQYRRRGILPTQVEENRIRTEKDICHRDIDLFNDQPKINGKKKVRADFSNQDLLRDGTIQQIITS